ncbi:MAG: superoxide dismutase [archaeon]|nr:superoxide dismutase [archaeon]
MVFSLPKLNFTYSDLEPFIDAKTVEVHYSKHHQTYCDKFNGAIEKHLKLSEKSAEELLIELDRIPEDIRTAVRNFGGGYVNHNFFWSILAPAGQKCKGKLLKEIIKKFGSFEEFKNKFSENALKVFGSGWTWLVLNNGELEIMNTANQDSPLTQGKIPLLVIDVWEHAYYLKYQNKRVEFIESWWNIINWNKVNEIFESAVNK